MLTMVVTQSGWLATAPQGAPGGNVLSSALIAVGFMILIWLLMRKQWGRQRGADATPTEQIAAGSTTARQRQRDEATEADLVQLSRRLLAQIDARSAHLEALIADADDRIAHLHEMDNSSRARPNEAGGAGDSGAPQRPDRRHESAASSAGEDPVTRGVYQLADRGLAPVEIARELDQHLGAVELILALRPK